MINISVIQTDADQLYNTGPVTLSMLDCVLKLRRVRAAQRVINMSPNKDTS